MSDLHELVLFDRSRVTTDWNCPRKRYWTYEYKGRGIVSSNTHLELFLGTTIHDGLAAFANQVPLEDVIKAAHEQVIEALLKDTSGEVDQVNFAMEQACLIEGMLRGFHKVVWPNLMKQYPVIKAIEQEMVYEYNGLTFMAKPDLVVQDNEGNNFYIEYKSTSSKKENWINSWDTAIQLHSTVKAIEQTLGEPVVGVQIVGLYKGYEVYGKQTSPFCYAYKRLGTPPFSQDQTSYDYKAGFKKYPVWEMPGGVAKWIEGMPENILGDQFPMPPPIFVNEDMVNSFFKQRAWREKEIHMTNQMMEGMSEENREGLMDVAYPQRYENCKPYFGKPCQYLRLCFSEVPNPLEAGFQWRIPHHQPELEQHVEDPVGSGLYQIRNSHHKLEREQDAPLEV